MYQVTIGKERPTDQLELFRIPTFYPGNTKQYNTWDYLETWCIKNHIDGYKIFLHGDSGCTFGFDNEEDAMAFKLRWS